MWIGSPVHSAGPRTRRRIESGDTMVVEVESVCAAVCWSIKKGEATTLELRPGSYDAGEKENLAEDMMCYF
jgi:hypothetical protein